MAIIRVKNVSKCFQLRTDRPRSFQELLVNALKPKVSLPEKSNETFWALRNVSFEVQPGEALGIVGANGSGKSTCLKLLTRILEPTTGTIEVNGRVSALLELGAGFHPDLTGRENIFLNGSVLGLSRREMVACLDDIVAFAELERFIDIPVKFYSSGMYVRLAFATAIHVKPDVLLVDEVLAVGDQSFQGKCLDYIYGLRARGVTIIFVSHSLDIVRNLCERALWLDEGELRANGPADVVVGRYLEHVYEKEEAAALAARAQKSANEPVGGCQGLQDPPTPEEENDPMARYRSRWGTREAEITDVRFLDRDGRERLFLTTGEPMTIAIRYHAHKRIEHPMFGLAIHRNDGLHINGPNNILANFDIPFIEREGEVRYMVDVLPLLEGTYCLTVALYDTSGTHAYDHQALWYRFRVRQGTNFERYGVIYIPARWEHLPAPTIVTER